ncbi:response regulator transcription factor [Paenibacillus hexagrammi]|uniref:Response regulator n=1 Tax=Paenibacillus hexagrammi TaxID=2908839 RepID=A0ABY3SRC5_9BACL|nr:response regulator [Paenibacillus sp. YPD9-1]UJF36110.1 response regulator [Paenibacillus sp. YPD9-1]
MYSLMLVDDEAGVRNSIKAKIDWRAAGYTIDAEASSGLEAMQLLSEGRQPDVMMTDIRMPQMNGIELIKACKEKYPHMRIIVLSGYSDYEYMKAAIQYGVKDYLLKPVIRSELTALLQKLADELEADRARERQQDQEELKNHQLFQMMQEQVIWQLVKDEWFSLPVVQERLQQVQLDFLSEEQVKAQFVTVEMRIPQGRLDDGSQRKDLLYLALLLLCRETAEKKGHVYPFYDVSHPAMVHFLIPIEEESNRNQGFVDSFVHDIKRNIRSYLRVDSVSGIGEPIKGLKQFKHGYASSMLAWSLSTVKSGKTDERHHMSQLANAFSPEAERKLMQSIENLDMHSFTKQVHELFSDHHDTPMFVFTFVMLRLILMFSAIAKKFELGDPSLQTYLWNCQMSVRDYQSREQVMEQLHDMARLVMEQVKKTRFSSGQQMTEAIRKYVDENFCYELTLSSLADMFHLNETYLSGLFKQQAGATFSDYVTRLRLQKAVELLKENELKLTDIATLVGYSSSSYFSTAFKKWYGKGPKEYRDELLGS